MTVWLASYMLADKQATCFLPKEEGDIGVIRFCDLLTMTVWLAENLRGIVVLYGGGG